MALIEKIGSGYLYYVSLKGVTGSDALDIKSVKDQYQRRKLQVSLPLMVGFGIKTPDMAREVAEFADGVIVGAALINEIHDASHEKKDSIKAGAALIEQMRSAMDNQGSYNE